MTLVWTGKPRSETQRLLLPWLSSSGPLEGVGRGNLCRTELRKDGGCVVLKRKKSSAHSQNLLLVIRWARLLTTHVSANPRRPRLLFHPRSSQATRDALSDQRSGTKIHRFPRPTPWPCCPEPPETEPLRINFPPSCTNSWWPKLRWDSSAFLVYFKSNFLITLSSSFCVKDWQTILFPSTSKWEQNDL